jgi:hypothetical protein
MSDFDDIEFVEPKKPEVAEAGEYPAKIIFCERQLAKSKLHTQKVIFQISNGKYADVTMYFSLWHPAEDTKRSFREQFSRLTTSVGFGNKYPNSEKDYLGKELTLDLKKVKESWDDNGEQKEKLVNKIVRYLPADDGGMSPPPEAIPKL